MFLFRFFCDLNEYMHFLPRLFVSVVCVIGLGSFNVYICVCVCVCVYIYIYIYM